MLQAPAVSRGSLAGLVRRYEEDGLPPSLRRSAQAGDVAIHDAVEGFQDCLLAGHPTVRERVPDLGEREEEVEEEGRPRLDFRPLFLEQGSHRDIGMVFQEESTFPWRTVEENVAFPLEIAGMAKAARMERAAHFIALVGLKGFERRYPAELSGGMRQRVAIARTLASEPRILLMDEPFAALDEQTRLLLGDKVLQIQQALRQTTLLITHNLTEAVQLSDRVLVMTYRPGRLKRSVTIDLPHPRDSEVVSSAAFGRYVAQIWQDLREEASRGIEDAEARVRLQGARR